MLNARSRIEHNLKRLPVAMHVVRKDLTKKLLAVKNKLLTLEKVKALEEEPKLESAPAKISDTERMEGMVGTSDRPVAEPGNVQ